MDALLKKNLRRISRQEKTYFRQKVVSLTYEEKREGKCNSVSYLCDENFNESEKKVKKVREHYHKKTLRNCSFVMKSKIQETQL